MNEIKFVDGVKYINYKDEWIEYTKLMIKKRRKLFIKWLKRVLVGPLLGFWLAFLGYHLFQIPLVPSLLIITAFTGIGVLLKYKYIKYAYLFFVASIYLFLIYKIFTI